LLVTVASPIARGAATVTVEVIALTATVAPAIVLPPSRAGRVSTQVSSPTLSSVLVGVDASSYVIDAREAAGGVRASSAVAATVTRHATLETEVSQ
jgi:hypothetical protein